MVGEEQLGSMVTFDVFISEAYLKTAKFQPGPNLFGQIYYILSLIVMAMFVLWYDN